MFTMLIADDEINICKLIHRLVDWDSLRIQCIGFSQNGQESYKIIKKEQPDIVLTDIRMPGLTGLELIKKCKDEGMSTQFIILSGYAQFNYAHTAIKYGVNDFLLKPINRMELNEALAETVKRLGPPKGTKGNSEPNEKLHKSLLYALIHNDFSPENQNVETINGEYRFHFREGNFQIGVVNLDCEGTADVHIYNLMKNLKKEFAAEISPLCYDFCITDKDTRIFFVINFSPAHTREIRLALQYAFSSMQNLIEPYGFLHLTMGISCITETVSELQDAYYRAYYACESRAVLGNGQILDGTPLDLSLAHIDNIYVEQPNKAISASLEIMDIPACVDLVSTEFYRQIPDLKKYPYCIYLYAQKFIRSVLMDISNLHPLQDSLSNLSNSLIKKVECCSGMEMIVACIQENVKAILEELESNSSDKKLISIVKNYIDESLGEHIDLENAAHKVYLSPAYLGILFKKETGINFSDYLTGVRIEKAKEMLKDVKYNIAEVAAAVGYNDQRYFSKVFKKLVGVRPTEYKKLNHLTYHQ